MTPPTARAIRFTLLGMAIALLLVNLSGMVGWTPKVVPPRDLNLVIILLLVASTAMRKRSNAPQEPAAKV